MTGRNVEIKARLSNPDHTASIATQIADSGPVIIEQEDVFFNCSKGRLKLRTFSDKTGELIYYNRDSGNGPSECNYSIVKTSDLSLIHSILTEALGVRGVIRKSHTLYMYGQTRIHLDDVSGLGKFVEIEDVFVRDMAFCIYILDPLAACIASEEYNHVCGGEAAADDFNDEF